MKKEKNYVGIFNDTFPPIMDGVAVCVNNYAYWLNKGNWQSCVVTPDIPKYKDDTDFTIFRYPSIPFIMRKPYRIGLPDLNPLMVKDISGQPYDIIHSHCPFTSGQLGLRIAKAHRVPLVATFHTKFRDNFEQVIPSKKIVDILVRQVISYFDAADEVWIPQASVVETLREYGYKGKVEIVENGVDVDKQVNVLINKYESKKRLNLKQTDFVLLFVGQHIWEKNLRFLMEALYMLRDVNFKMFFIGTGYAEKELRMLAEELHLRDKITFVGPVLDRHLLKQYYAAADLFLFPSLYDNAPLVVREAASMGTPSLLLKESTCAGIIQDNLNGFLARYNKADYAAKIRGLHTQRPLIEKVGLTSVDTICRSWEDILEEVKDRYASLIKRYERSY